MYCLQAGVAGPSRRGLTLTEVYDVKIRELEHEFKVMRDTQETKIKVSGVVSLLHFC